MERPCPPPSALSLKNIVIKRIRTVQSADFVDYNRSQMRLTVRRIYCSKKVLKNLTRLDKYEKISIGSVFPMYLENVEYSAIYIGDFAVFPRSAGSADSHEIPGGRPK